MKKWTKLDKNEQRGFFALPVGGLGGVDPTVQFKWPIAAGYDEKDGKICPNGFKEYTSPLDDPDLFSSLAHLSENGEPTKTKILRWVRTHGLLTRENIR